MPTEGLYSLGFYRSKMAPTCPSVTCLIYCFFLLLGVSQLMQAVSQSGRWGCRWSFVFVFTSSGLFLQTLNIPQQDTGQGWLISFNSQPVPNLHLPPCLILHLGPHCCYCCPERSHCAMAKHVSGHKVKLKPRSKRVHEIAGCQRSCRLCERLN